jgi:protein phosphatase
MTAAPRPRVVVSLRTDVGCRREVNEDSGLAVTPHDPAELASKGVLVLVADGMGGHAAGEVASRLAVDTIRTAYYRSPDGPRAALVNAFELANRAIYDAARKDQRLAGMGTTCTGLAVHGGHAACAHVGDSRLYLVRGGQIYTMTEDHSAVRDLVKRGLLSAADARHHEERNVILRALGTRPRVEVASWDDPLPVRAGDGFVVCSDGLHDLVEAEELLEAVEQLDPAGACDRLVHLARERGGYDNITVAVLRVEAADHGGAAAPDTREVRARS